MRPRSYYPVVPSGRRHGVPPPRSYFYPVVDMDGGGSPPCPPPSGRPPPRSYFYPVVDMDDIRSSTPTNSGEEQTLCDKSSPSKTQERTRLPSPFPQVVAVRHSSSHSPVTRMSPHLHRSRSLHPRPAPTTSLQVAPPTSRPNHVTPGPAPLRPNHVTPGPAPLRPNHITPAPWESARRRPCRRIGARGCCS